ncbi:MAG: extracellular solute-binding protein, partial [Candidatus Rifleibacteriota bacterium]
VLFYNRLLFAEAGLNPEQPPQTWAELLSAAQKIHQPAAGRYGFGMNAGEAHILYKKFMPLVWANGGRIIADDGSWAFNSRETRQALEFYLQLKNFSYCEKQDLLDEAFKKGTLGMMVSGAWNFASFPKDAPELDFSVALMPRPAENKGVEASFLGGQVLVLLKNCREPELAARFIRFLARAENSLPISREALVNFPAARSSYTDSLFTGDPRLQVFVEQMKTAVHPPVHRYWMEIEKILNQGIEKAMYGQNIDQVLAETSQAFEKLDGGKTQAIRQADVQAMPVGNGSWQTILLVLIALGTLLNAILLTFLLVEVKKNAA